MLALFVLVMQNSITGTCELETSVNSSCAMNEEIEAKLHEQQYINCTLFTN